MDPPPLDALAARFGLDPKRFRQALRAGQQEGTVLLVDEDRTAQPPLWALGLLGRVLAGQLSPLEQECAGAVQALLTALGRRLELRTMSPEQVPDRPRIPGLPEAAAALAEAKEQHPARMTNAEVDPGWLRQASSRIVAKRALLEELQAFARWLGADLAVEEVETERAVRDGYQPVREAARRDPGLGRALGRVEDYLYGPAKAAAEARSASRRAQQKLQERVGAEAFLRGVDEGQRRMEERLHAVLGEDRPDRADR
ncbi:MAG: hypothetical protein RMK29_20345 [Myxococcales bacterium]|nr:hypothetical protein [Myxococcales bacterium]